VTPLFSTAQKKILFLLVINTKPLFKDKVKASINMQNMFNIKWLDPGKKKEINFTR
jgi:hypothetical protein